MAGKDKVFCQFVTTMVIVGICIMFCSTIVLVATSVTIAGQVSSPSQPRPRFVMPVRRDQMVQLAPNIFKMYYDIDKRVAAIFYVEKDLSEPTLHGIETSTCCRYQDGLPKLYEEDQRWEIDWYNRSLITWFQNSFQQYNNAVNKPMIGQGIPAVTNGIAYNNKNQISFGEIDEDIGGGDALALTAIWVQCPQYGRTVDNCKERLKIMEWDMVFDDMRFLWSLEPESSSYHLPSVILHEIVHVFGLDDLYNELCRNSVAYGICSLTRNIVTLDEYTRLCLHNLYDPSSNNPANCNNRMFSILQLF